MIFRTIVSALLILFPIYTNLLAEASKFHGKHSTAELTLIADKDHSYLVLEMEPNPGWHLYWKNPGDSGSGLVVNWKNLPQPLDGSWSWPYPTRIELGSIQNFGYESKFRLISSIPKSIDLNTLQKNPIRGLFTWSACKEECIVESAELTARVLTSNQPNYTKLISSIQEELQNIHPKKMEPHWKASFQEKKGHFGLELELGDSFPQGIKKIEFFPLQKEILVTDKPSIRQISNTLYEIDLPKANESTEDTELLSGLFVMDGVPYEISFSRETSYFFLQAIIFAFLGGLLLNLMPCVFPILTMKAMSVVQSSAMVSKEKRKDSLFYSMGIISFFWFLYLIFLGIKTGGASLGWGFQLQNPSFVFLLTLLFVLMGFQMMGWIEMTVGVKGPLAKLTDKKGYWGSYFSGALAVLVATPCTAPFMGSALAYAFSESSVVGLSIFTSLGLGMAVPVALLQNSKLVAKWIPKPGEWMNTFKELLAFPLFLTAVWLLWVLAGITNRNEAFYALAGIVFILLLIWAFKKLKKSNKKTLLLSFILATILGFALTIQPVKKLSSINSSKINSQSAIKFGFENHINYSTDNLKQALETNHSVFLYFTADWCVTCKYNERSVLATEEIESFFKENKILVVKADWTNEDPEITKALESFGRSGVPLYIFYPKEKKSNPKILPQLLSTANLTLSLK
jgi:thiol:disulfide interchange protein DsbD